MLNDEFCIFERCNLITLLQHLKFQRDLGELHE